MAMPRLMMMAPLLIILSIFLLTAHAGMDKSPVDRDTRQQEALTSFDNLIKEGKTLLVESEIELAKSKDAPEEDRNCLTTLDRNLKGYMDPLAKLAPDQSDAQFFEARDRLTEMLRWPSDTGASCSEKTYKARPVVGKINDWEAKLQGTLNLMKAV